MSAATMKGIDVSVWQGVIDWAKAAPAIDYAMVRSSNGAEVDVQHDRNVSALRAAGKPLGHYHYPEGADPIAEAHFFVAHSGWRNGELQMLDYEGPLTGHPDPVGWSAAFLTEVFEITGNRALIYMNEAAVNEQDWARVIELNTGLVVADWNKDTPKPGGWPFFIERQTGDRGQIPGIEGLVDVDVFYGDAETFAKYGAGHPDPEPAPTPHPEPEPAVELYTVVEGDNLTEIAARFGVSVDQLVAWNVGTYPSLQTNRNLIVVGWILHIHGSQPMPGPGTDEQWYTVLHGDNLTTIGEQFNATVEQLVAWNKGHYPSLATNDNLIGVGWRLRVR